MDKVNSDKTVLVVDDDPEIREVFKMALENEGYTVTTASNGKEALDIMGQVPPPSIVMLDLMMPVMNGYDFLKAVQSQKKLSDIPVIVISAFSKNEELPGAKKILTKPIDLDALLDTISHWINVSAA